MKQIIILSLCLLALISAQSPTCFKIYDSKWQHCCNLDELGGCFAGLTPEEAAIKCQSNPKCEGFSFTHNGQKGDGCFKHRCDNPCDAGFGSGTHDHFQCQATIFDRPGKKSACYKKFFGRWKHCENYGDLGGCFGDTNIDTIMKTCGQKDGCEGFSFPVNTKQGGGCYKNRCVENPGDAGFGKGSHDGWVCDNVQYNVLDLTVKPKVEPPKVANKKCVELYNKCNFEGDKVLLCEGDNYVNFPSTFRVKSIRTNGLSVEVYNKIDVQGEFNTYSTDQTCLN